MSTYIRPAITFTLGFILLTGLAYPLAITGMAQIAFPAQANGSLVRDDDAVVGSRLIGQSFAGARYFWPRPSVTAAAPYNAAASGGSNLGPTASALAARVKGSVEQLRAAGLAGAIPADAAMASGSGLDPDISPAYAVAQVARVASARGVSQAAIAALVERFTDRRLFGIVGESRVNVLMLNLALDALKTG